MWSVSKCGCFLIQESNTPHIWGGMSFNPVHLVSEIHFSITTRQVQGNSEYFNLKIFIEQIFFKLPCQAFVFQGDFLIRAYRVVAHYLAERKASTFLHDENQPFLTNLKTLPGKIDCHPSKFKLPRKSVKALIEV